MPLVRALSYIYSCQAFSKNTYKSSQKLWTKCQKAEFSCSNAKLEHTNNSNGTWTTTLCVHLNASNDLESTCVCPLPLLHNEHAAEEQGRRNGIE